MGINSPFTPATKRQTKIKVLLYGGAGVGKTLAALSFPRCAVIDTEGSTSLYQGREGYPSFDVLETSSVKQVEEAINFIRADKGASYDTLVFDSVSVLYNVLRKAEAAKNANSTDMTFQNWARINRALGDLYASLTNMPVHLVLIAREATEYITEGRNLKATGVKPEIDKSLLYSADFVIRMTYGGRGEVTKARASNFPIALQKVSWSSFASVIGAPIPLAEQFKDRATVERFVSDWSDLGQAADLVRILGVGKFSEWTAGLDAANARMKSITDELANNGMGMEVDSLDSDEGGDYGTPNR